MSMALCASTPSLKCRHDACLMHSPCPQIVGEHRDSGLLCLLKRMPSTATRMQFCRPDSAKITAGRPHNGSIGPQAYLRLSRSQHSVSLRVSAFNLYTWTSNPSRAAITMYHARPRNVPSRSPCVSYTVLTLTSHHESIHNANEFSEEAVFLVGLLSIPPCRAEGSSKFGPPGSCGHHLLGQSACRKERAMRLLNVTNDLHTRNCAKERSGLSLQLASPCRRLW